MTWTGLHCRVNWRRADVDTFIADALAPAMAAHEWYFLRYWETGPHLRVRVKGDPGRLGTVLRDLIAAQEFETTGDEPGWLPHGDVREAEYVPETARYGGPKALPVAEEVFCRSTEVAVAVLKAARTDSARLTAAIELTVATARALGLDLPRAASWLRTLGTSWRNVDEWAPAPTLGSHTAAHRLIAHRGEDLAGRWHREPTGATAHWVAAIRAAVEELATWLPHVWASQLHMLLNRLGITPNEERTICWTTAAAALSPTGLTGFHDDGATAPDRRYLEASKFLPGFADQLPRRTAPVPQQFAPWLPRTPLESTVDEKLAGPLRSRRTSRDLRGTLGADRLGTLLWTSMSPADGRRPYPSAGARYCARLRLVALDVQGLASGSYEVDELGRTLVRLGDAPSVEDLEATSMWFGEGTTELAATPAVLALYIRIGELRRTYGLRALRFAFTEAGHLAQNLTVTAASQGIRTGLVGGFYDDIAHDVIGLDGVDDALVYFLPLAS
ncbi:thiopeptide-type bacteriocin biosynthesis domain-containing protein [Lentzea xinjiangensis]|uniref:Thiopeptide-type bacteriocin biosynthesis domain-containing protein n=1 Tax=Lentzea xinjiangensis TaxID=402600 RepID=A0A1H9LW15_9PSEU|nr:thiopeptide-type bacteriocin biosynthesis protein [Lentzea xinjiangensis]SER15548.1 thiopeptide-type bacteriocin biosynthesis domain-containing protein [Lentzea xinjiangensis]